MTAVFDSSVFDELVKPEYQGLLMLLEETKFEILITHVQEDELGKIADSEKRTKILDLVEKIAKKIPTAGFVFGSVNPSKRI